MKKSIISFILGFVFATAGSVYAADVASMIGKTVEGEFLVKVNGVTVDKKALVIDDTSYLPVRAIGEALNMDVKFDADLGIELTEKEAVTLQSTGTIEMTPEDAENIRVSEEQIGLAQKRIAENETKIADLEKQIGPKQEQINSTTDSQQLSYRIAELKSIQDQIENIKVQITMDQEIIVSTQAYIEKIKAKYATP